ncbi:hypothetical protein BHU72_10910 [Desulfuribacillus stibiiarsenatis]|uniref:histidine kinase n=1 Tax=Desulfuribacillus stibiiarsenatis TaxID=1390249 RepID=A0A1E5L2S7_9FIRM|nr:hypothetical protein BHU72_10910 [Desulfuribacillus stibiiarsenatis]
MQGTGFALKDLKGTNFLSLLPEDKERKHIYDFLEMIQNGLDKNDVVNKAIELHQVRVQGAHEVYVTNIRYFIHCDVLRQKADGKDEIMILLESFKDFVVEDIIVMAREKLTTDIKMGFVVQDVTGKIIEINEQAANFYGTNREELLNAQKRDKLKGFPKDYFFGEQTLESGIPLHNHTVSWKVGDKLHSFVIDTNLLKRNSEIIGVLVLIKDISNVKSLELQIQHNERLAMVGQIAAGTAHEIRNPITSIKGFLQLMQKSLTDNQMQKEMYYTEVMLGEVERITNLLNEFLLLSKPRDLKVEDCKPKEIMDIIQPIISNEALLKGIEVCYKVDSISNCIRVDRELLKQVFLNLAKNALEAMGDNGKLEICVESVDDHKSIRFSFKDSGPGIPAYMIDKIFDPFFTTKDNGTGLGLSVCQRIVADLGGQIKVSSKGFGTTFSVLLPVFS